MRKKRNQILKAIEEAYRKGLRDGNSVKNISPFLITSHVVAIDVANKFFKADIASSVCKHKNIKYGIGYSYCDDCKTEIFCF